MIWMHVAAGFIALGAGAVALSSSKGARLHRKSGAIFVYGMLLMTLSGGALAAMQMAAEPIHLLSIPVVLVLLSLVYWLVRIFVSNRRARMMHASASAGV